MTQPTHSIWNQDLMRQIINSVADGVFIVDPKGLISFWNPSMETISGFTAQEAMGKPCNLIACSSCPEEGCTDGFSDCSNINSKISETIECVLKHKNGTDVPIIKKSAAVTDSHGNFLGVVEAVTDISELKLARKKAQEAAIRLGDLQGMNQIVGKSHEIQRVFTSLNAAASSDATILIQGESGTGKELVASAIHYNSDRRDRPFIIVNCSALSESLLESELFGHVKGAYTGAVKDRVGRFEEAEGGTLFLDEIGELSPYIQVKLLRVLQEREIERVGDSQKRKVNIRIITATHRDLLGMVVEGKFREDLYYRLKVFPITLPPLKARKDDVPLLVGKFIEKMNEKSGKEIENVSQPAMKALLDYHWPGNVRELENAIEHAFVLCNGPLIELDDLPREIKEMGLTPLTTIQPAINANSPQPYQSIQTNPYNQNYQSFSNLSIPATAPTFNNTAPPKPRRPKIKKEELLTLLDECDWNKKEAGRRLGVSHTAIWKYMKKWDIPLKK